MNILSTDFTIEVKYMCPQTEKYESNQISSKFLLSFENKDSVSVFIKKCNSCKHGHYVQLN